MKYEKEGGGVCEVMGGVGKVWWKEGVWVVRGVNKKVWWKVEV